MDKTGLRGKYDYNLEFSPAAGRCPVEGQTLPAPDLVGGGARTSSGLKMQSKKGPIEMVIVDHIEKTPGEN